MPNGRNVRRKGNWKRTWPQGNAQQPQPPTPPAPPEPPAPAEQAEVQEGGEREAWEVVFSTYHKSPDGSGKWLKVLVTPEGNYILKIGEGAGDNKVNVYISLSDEERARLSLVLQQADLISELKRIKSMLADLKG